MNFFSILLLLLIGGIFGVLHRIPAEQIGFTFYRLITYLFLIGLTLILVSFQPENTYGWIQFSLILISVILGFIFRYFLLSDYNSIRNFLYWTITGIILVLLWSVVYLSPLPDVMKPITTLEFQFLHLFTSAAILGAIVDAMICGHWYLENPDLSLDPIQSISRTLTLFIILKIILVGLTLIQTKSNNAFLFERVVFYRPILFWFRLLVGLAGGLFFNWMSWKALEYGNTQASTGILYACITWIILGEFSGFYLTIQMGVPL